MSNILSGPPLSEGFWSSLNKPVGSYILEYIRRNEDRVYMIDGTTNEQLTLHELSEKSLILATYLQNLGCRLSKTNVAIYSENHINYMIAQLGIWHSGSTPALLNHLYTFNELKHSINIVKPKILICSLQTYSTAKEIQEKNDFVKHLILLDDPPLPVPNVLLFSNLTKKSVTMRLIQPLFTDLNGPALIIFSSGTTGLPKAVLHTHRNILYSLQMTKTYDLIDLQGDCTLTAIPMFHIYGVFVNLLALMLDKTLIFLKRFDEELYLSLVQKYKIQNLFLVPPLVQTLLNSDLVKKYDISSVQYVICGGAPLKTNAEKEIIEKLKLRRLQQGYGMSESTFSMTFKRPEDMKLGTCGTLVAGVEGKVVDIETGQILESGQTGELCFKTPGMMKGYIDNPEATADIIRDRWLHTGDLGYYDDDGHFFIVDRLKELIKWKAHQVAPAELEAILLKHPDVEDAGVIGIPNDAAGELPKAFVVRKKQSTVSEKELQQYVASNVSPMKQLRGGVRFIDEIPRNPSGKILRRKLRELAACEIPNKY